MSADAAEPALEETRAPLRILLVGPVPPPHAGMSAQVVRWTENLRREGHSVRNVSTQLGLREHPLARQFLFLRQLLPAVSWCQVLNVHTGSWASFHAFATPSVILARLLGRRALLTYKGGEAAPFLRSSRLARWTLRRAHAVLVPSRFLERVMADFSIRATIVPNIVAAPEMCSGVGSREPSRRIIVTRNLEPLYSVETALQAFKHIRGQVSDVRLDIYGDGSQRGPLQALVAREELKDVTFHGNVSPEKVYEALLGAAVFLNPSTVDNTPNSVIEALHAGVPAVSTDVGGVSYLVKDGESALLVPPNNPRRMAEAAIQILQDPNMARTLAENGRSVAQSFVWPAVYRAYRGVLEI